MTINPEQAWQSALGQLQMEMPKASFDTWVRDTRLVSYEDGLFTIGVRNAYARDWLESRLSSTVTRLLLGIMDRTVDVSFVVASPVTADDDREGASDDDENEPETAEVQIVHRLRYDEVVLPGRVVALPGYFSRLIPEIGARNAWLYVGWRQAVWDGHRQDRSPRTRRIPIRQIIRYSGLSRRTFFRAVEEPSTWEALAGLVERSDTEPHWKRGGDRHPHRLPNRYTVHMTLRLSRSDAVAVRNRLADQMQAGASLLNALGEAIRTPDLVGELLPPAGLAPAISALAIPQTVMDIACNLGGSEDNLSSDLRAAAEALHQRIISGFGTILLTHYFLETVIPQAGLTAPQAWLVALLRDRCYVNTETGERRDQVLVRGGYGELADWLGLSRSKTVWEWIRDEAGPVSAFVCVLPFAEQDLPDALRLCVRLDEPIFDGADGTHTMARMAPADGASDTINHGANGTHRMAEMAPLDGANGTTGWREWHRLKHLSTNSNTQEKNTTTTQVAPAAAPSAWVLKKLLIQSRVHPKVTKDLLAKNASVQAFVSWLLFACSKAGEGINNPLAYALASLREDPVRGPGGAYDRLAALPPAELIQLVRWSVQMASSKYSLNEEPCGNDLWEKTMGASGRHDVLLAILLGEEGDTPVWERKVTQVSVDGEEVKHETIVSHYRNG
jgi:hypothetical protein